MKAREPRQRFLRTAPRRTQRVLDALASLGRCSNRVTYRYESHEVRQVFSAIEAELARARARFSEAPEPPFSLGGSSPGAARR